ncbi:hypothetical protein [Sulfuricurvum sp.]|uniref:hypothetical protein n=1 Tax=Sulfuricurvum sp. TaxID=2025608 RepID=UPI002625DD83|nr:hypothetical protein [Sulfuricurvum sp.]MDD2266705.1 hypothetical protein [Sulfuricurvum sp.]
MFVLGFHFPADMGNIIPDEKVIEKLADVDISDVKEIKLLMGTKDKDKEWISYTNKDTFLFKAMVHYFKEENPDKTQKYMIYMNRYQMSAISKRVDAADDETMKLCHNLDSMEQFRIEVA